MFAPQLLSIYIPDSPEAIAYGIQRLAYIALPYFLLGIQDVTAGVLRGFGSSLAPTLISVLGICGLRIAWIYTIFQIPRFHTPGWLFLSYPVSWIVTLLAQFALYVFVYRRNVEKYEKAGLGG